MNTRRYVRTMDLRSDPDLIAEYAGVMPGAMFGPK